MTVYVNHVNRNFKIPRSDGNESIKKKLKPKIPIGLISFAVSFQLDCKMVVFFLKIGLVYGT